MSFWVSFRISKREAYEKEKALANADAMHRAARIAIAAGAMPPAVIATAPSIDIAAGTTPPTAIATAPIITDAAQALRDPTTDGGGTGNNRAHNRPPPSTVMGRFGQRFACFAHSGGANPSPPPNRRRRKPDAAGK